MVITRRIIVKRRGGHGATASPEDKAAFAVTAMLLAHLAGVVADTCLHLAGMRTKPKIRWQQLCRYTQTGVPSPTRQGRRRSGAATTDHGPGPPRTGPEPPRAGPGPLQVEAGPPGGLSHRASQGTRTQQPIWVGSPEPSQAPVGAAADPRVRRRHVSHRADLRTFAPRLGRGPEPPRAPVGTAADPRVRCRHVSNRHESSA